MINAMPEFTFEALPVRVVFGVGRIDSLSDEAARSPESSIKL
jgi:hypothetical protein